MSDANDSEVEDDNTDNGSVLLDGIAAIIANEGDGSEDPETALSDENYRAWLESMDYNVTAENEFYRLFKTFDEVNKKDTDSIIYLRLCLLSHVTPSEQVARVTRN